MEKQENCAFDNCPAHSDVKLKQIKLIFVPLSTSSQLQPIDQGMIHSEKTLQKDFDDDVRYN